MSAADARITQEARREFNAGVRRERAKIEAAAEHRLTPTQRLHEVTMQALARTPRSGQDVIEVGQEARTKDWYVKSLTVYRLPDEGWDPWLERMGQMTTMAATYLPAGGGTNGGATE